MGFFFGKNESGFRTGNMTNFAGDFGHEDTLFDSGNMTFGKNGSMCHSGNMSYMSNGLTITKGGNCYYCNGETYFQNGNMLYGPDGKSWSSNGLTDRDIRNIIYHDNN